MNLQYYTTSALNYFRRYLTDLIFQEEREEGCISCIDPDSAKVIPVYLYFETPASSSPLIVVDGSHQEHSGTVCRYCNFAVMVLASKTGKNLIFNQSAIDNCMYQLPPYINYPFYIKTFKGRALDIRLLFNPQDQIRQVHHFSRKECTQALAFSEKTYPLHPEVIQAVSTRLDELNQAKTPSCLTPTSTAPGAYK